MCSNCGNHIFYKKKTVLDIVDDINLFFLTALNPVNALDPDGVAVANIVGGVVGGVAGAALGALLTRQLGLTGWKKWALISAATVGGAALGAFLGPYVAKLDGRIVSMTKKSGIFL